jgi:hypothetical protein
MATDCRGDADCIGPHPRNICNLWPKPAWASWVLWNICGGWQIRVLRGGKNQRSDLVGYGRIYSGEVFGIPSWIPVHPDGADALCSTRFRCACIRKSSDLVPPCIALWRLVWTPVGRPHGAACVYENCAQAWSSSVSVLRSFPATLSTAATYPSGVCSHIHQLGRRVNF